MLTQEREAGMADHDCNFTYKKDLRTALPQILAVSVKNLLLLGYGMTLGFPTILMPAVQNPREGEVLYLQKSQISWIGSINLIVVPVGCALSGLLTAPIGRRRAMQIVNLPFFVAWLLFHYSNTTEHLYGALFLTGLAGGLLEAPVLTYVAEITQPHLRGLLSATSSMSIILGVFTQFLFGLFLYWRVVALLNVVVPVLVVVALCFVPESPHWLVSKKRHDEARKAKKERKKERKKEKKKRVSLAEGIANMNAGRCYMGFLETDDFRGSKSLQWLRGWTTPDAVEAELKEIQALFNNGIIKTDEIKGSLSDEVSLYLKKSFLVPYFLVCFSFFVGHFSGMSTLQMLEAPIDKYYATLILGILQIVGTGICVLLVHFTGKRPLTLVSTAGAAVCCLLVASYDVYIRNLGVPEMTSSNSTASLPVSTTETMQAATNNPYSWMPTTLLMLLALITHTGIRLLPWILIGEVFSANTRSGGAGLASAVGYIFGFLANKMYISMVDSMSIWGTYGLYGLISTIGCVTFYFILPETEGKKLNEIQDHFAGIRKLTNDVYRSKRRRIPEISKMRDLKGTTNMSYEDDVVK